MEQKSTGMYQRFGLIVLCSVLFIFTLYSSFVTFFNVLNYEGIDFSKDVEPVNNVILRDRLQPEIVLGQLGLMNNDKESLHEYVYTEFYFEILDNQTNETIKLESSYSNPLPEDQIAGRTTFNLQTKEKEGPLQVNISRNTDKNYTLVLGWDVNNRMYQESIKTTEFFTARTGLIWGLLGWPVLLVAWILLLITHYRHAKEGLFTSIPIEVLSLIFILLFPLTLTFVLGISGPRFIYTTPQIFYLMAYVIVTSLILALCFTFFIMILIAKIKTKTVFKNSLIVGIFKGIENFFNQLSGQMRFITLIIGFLFINFLFLTGFNDPVFRILSIVFNLFVLYRLLQVNKQRLNINQHLRELRDGEIEHPLNKENYFKMYHDNIDNINNLQEGLQAALEKSLQDERMSIDLITNVSHDLKTPLTTIINYTDFLIEGINPEKHDEYLQVIKEKSLRLSELANSVVEASKASSGKMEVELVDLNALELLNQVLVDHQEPFINKELVLLVDENSLDYLVKADSQKLYRVFENLFKNIEKYAQENSRVYVEGKNESESLLITFKNVSKYALGSQDLTARFVQGDLSRQQEGSGLGLAIAKDLMRLMGGDLTIEVDGDLFKVMLTLNKVEI